MKIIKSFLITCFCISVFLPYGCGMEVDSTEGVEVFMSCFKDCIQRRDLIDQAYNLLVKLRSDHTFCLEVARMEVVAPDTTFSALHFAAMFNHAGMARELISCFKGKAPFFAAQFVGGGEDTTRAEECFVLGSVNVVDSLDNTPLHVAVCSGSVDVARVLLDAGADVTFINSDGNTSWDCIRDGDEAMVAFCKEYRGREVGYLPVIEEKVGC